MKRESFPQELPDFLARGPLGEIRLAGHRIDLHLFVYYVNEGYTAEMLSCQFPSLEPALIQQALGFYLQERAVVDPYVAEVRSRIEAQSSTGEHVPSLEELRRRREERRRMEIVTSIAGS